MAEEVADILHPSILCSRLIRKEDTAEVELTTEVTQVAQVIIERVRQKYQCANHKENGAEIVVVVESAESATGLVGFIASVLVMTAIALHAQIIAGVAHHVMGVVSGMNNCI